MAGGGYSSALIGEMRSDVNDVSVFDVWIWIERSVICHAAATDEGSRYPLWP